MTPGRVLAFHARPACQGAQTVFCTPHTPLICREHESLPGLSCCLLTGPGLLVSLSRFSTGGSMYFIHVMQFTQFMYTLHYYANYANPCIIMHIMQRLHYYANYEHTLYYYHNYIDYAYNVNYTVETWVGSGNQPGSPSRPWPPRARATRKPQAGSWAGLRMDLKFKHEFKGHLKLF